MRRDFRGKKRAILALLALLVAADIALGAYTWKLASAGTAQQELALLTRNRDLLKKDIRRAQEIQARIPDIQKDCDAFEQSLFSGSTVNSTVSAELSALAAKSNLRLDNTQFHRKDVKGRNLTELEINAQVIGDYRNVVRFLNGLQRSANFYAVEGLSARSEAKENGAKGALRVEIHIKTYQRPA